MKKSNCVLAIAIVLAFPSADTVMARTSAR